MKLQTVKRNIIEVLKGERVEAKELHRYFCNIKEEMKAFTPSRWLFNFTEIEMPEACLDSVYRVICEKTEKNKKFLEKGLCSATDILIFLGTEDGISADYICSIFPFDTPLETENYIHTVLRQKT